MAEVIGVEDGRVEVQPQKKVEDTDREFTCEEWNKLLLFTCYIFKMMSDKAKMYSLIPDAFKQNTHIM